MIEISIAKIYGKKPRYEVMVWNDDDVIESVPVWFYDLDSAISKAQALRVKYPDSVVFLSDVLIGKRRALTMPTTAE